MAGMEGQFGEVLSAMRQASQAAEKGDLASVRTAVEAISDRQQRSFGELMMAEAYASSGDAKSALDTLRRLKPVSQRAQFAGSFAQGLAQKGKFVEADEALKIGMAAAETEENDSELEALAVAAVQVHAEAGDDDAARAKADGWRALWVVVTFWGALPFAVLLFAKGGPLFSALSFVAYL